MITKTIRQILALRRWKSDREHQQARASLPMATMREIAKKDEQHIYNPILEGWKKKKLEQGYDAKEISRAIVIAVGVEAVGVIAIAYTNPRVVRSDTAMAFFDWRRVMANADQALIRNELKEALRS